MPKKDKYNEMLDPLSAALDNVSIGEPTLLQSYEQDHIDKELDENEDISKMMALRILIAIYQSHNYQWRSIHLQHELFYLDMVP